MPRATTPENNKRNPKIINAVAIRAVRAVRSKSKVFTSKLPSDFSVAIEGVRTAHAVSNACAKKARVKTAIAE